MAEMTPWFPGTVPPARDGVYELYPVPGIVCNYAKFQRGRWFSASRTPAEAMYEPIESCLKRSAERKTAVWQWRGFTEKQEG